MQTVFAGQSISNIKIKYQRREAYAVPRHPKYSCSFPLFHLLSSRYHTLVFVPSSCVVYAFGCNIHGQLGTGMMGPARSPFPVKANFLRGNFHSTGMCCLYGYISKSISLYILIRCFVEKSNLASLFLNVTLL